jgi:chromosome segregation ATPase
MNGNSKPFQRACAWCGEAFTTRRETDNSCSLGCSEELHQATEELHLAKAEFRSVRDQVEVLHEKLCRVHLRVERQVNKLQRLGVQWQKAENDEDKDEIEKRERLTAKTLERLNDLLDRRNNEAIPKERRLAKIEHDLNNLKNIVGDDSSLDDF